MDRQSHPKKRIGTYGDCNPKDKPPHINPVRLILEKICTPRAAGYLPTTKENVPVDTASVGALPDSRGSKHPSQAPVNM
jgi:hypothetical protein